MTTALDRWAAAGLVEVTLPSGFRVRILPVTPSALVMFGLAPSIVGDVLGMADAPAPEIEARLGQTALDIALRAVKDVWDDEAGEWMPVTLTAAVVARGAFPPEDLDRIMETSLAPLEAAGEGPVSLDDLRTFRDERPGHGPGTDGGTLGEPTQLPRRTRRAAARTGARRGPRHAAAGG
jgi:hypothetical protein